MQEWKCEVCKLYNDVLTNHCKACYAHKPLWLTGRYQALVEITRGIFLRRMESYEWEIHERKEMTPQEELFSKYYNQEKILVKDMDIIELREHREVLAQIAFEAKAKLVAVDDEVRDRNSKAKNKDWILTDTQPSPDAINAVKVRAARMSKMDKMRVQLLAAGIDEDTVNTMIRTMEKKATESDVKAINFGKPKAIDIVKPKEPPPAASNGGENPFSKFK